MMSPHTEANETQIAFAADVLHGLLDHIRVKNAQGADPFLVSHAWTNGAIMYLVYQAPPSDITWGLVRDTRRSILDPTDPWPSLDEAVLYYYLLDLEEGRMSASFPHPGDPTAILWCPYPAERADLPRRPADIPDVFRYKAPPTDTPPVSQPPNQDEHRVVPRLYYDPSQVEDET